MSFISVLSDLRTAVVFLAMISVLVAAHEYGHYVFARIFGMGVEEFAIGMGKKLSIWRRKSYRIPVPRSYVHDQTLTSRGSAFEGGSRTVDSELIETPEGQALQESTEFTIRMLPIGGFVRIKGMVPEDDGSEVRIPGGFYSKPPWQRLVVLAAGPAASVLSGLIVLTLLFYMNGVERPIDEPVLGDVAPKSVAQVAGLRAGDRIVAVNDRPIATFYQLVQAISSHGGKPLKLQYARGANGGTITLTPNITEAPTLGPDLERGTEVTKHGIVGIGPIRHPVSVGLWGASKEACRVPVLAVESMFEIARQPSSLKEQAGGAITMVAATHAATEAGIFQTMLLACLLSISVGIFNLLPIPPLDGGQMVMAFAELLRGGKRLSIQVQQVVTNAGVLLVLMLAAIVFFIDIQRFAAPNHSPADAPKPAKEAPSGQPGGRMPLDSSKP